MTDFFRNVFVMVAKLIWIMESSITYSQIFNYIFLVIWELLSFNLVN